LNSGCPNRPNLKNLPHLLTVAKFQISAATCCAFRASSSVLQAHFLFVRASSCMFLAGTHRPDPLSLRILCVFVATYQEPTRRARRKRNLTSFLVLHGTLKLRWQKFKTENLGELFAVATQDV
jgi:hypothetical protein